MTIDPLDLFDSIPCAADHTLARRRLLAGT
ncbi:hypothetical protein J2Z21_002855 [Streptomyces griseochromogenes]|uniref:Transcriptional regulator n=1 Tax=Streptomyces griseochromogenes TaxID=68214 RepID=A0ABS4LR76_9ACTN|nr:hypothetical protein [Streptomyces griseochromogenes]